MNIIRGGEHRHRSPMRRNDKVPPALVQADLERPTLPEPAREPAPAIALLEAWRSHFAAGRLLEAGEALEQLSALTKRPPRPKWEYPKPEK